LRDLISSIAFLIRFIVVKLYRLLCRGVDVAGSPKHDPAHSAHRHGSLLTSVWQIGHLSVRGVGLSDTVHCGFSQSGVCIFADQLRQIDKQD
jgi:hypothetical protein